MDPDFDRSSVMQNGTISFQPIIVWFLDKLSSVIFIQPSVCGI